ncbi:23S rRNA (uracil(1939)-C(5))-methyltransferase RlmD [Paenibacillus sp. NPDC058174]|uniref:23S rRNA (uracil(1939)-C(5))-methyltransferase RlmD n=1 Tax=Paenibacillus sp. NPDC058174 TaxID=3346366 RepID=UPI0036DEB6AF
MSRRGNNGRGQAGGGARRQTGSRGAGVRNGAGSKGGTNVKEKAREDAPFQKNEEVTVDIIGLTHDGEGVGRADGFTLFIQGALPGERVRAKVMKVKKQYGYARLEELLSESSDRVEPPCDIFDKCGGCQLQHFDYPAQLEWKRQHVIDSLERIGKLRVAGGKAFANGDGEDDAMGEGIIVHPTVGMAEPWRYRNKAQVPVGASGGAGSELIAGFYARGSHRIIDMDDCLIQHDRNDEVVRVVKTIGRELGISAYDEESGKGLLRHVMARTGFITGEIMVVLVTNGTKLPQAEEWIKQIREALPAVKSIVQNVNKRDTNVVFGDETRVLWGSEVIYDELDGIRFAISARSFYQVNPAQTVELYRKAVEYAGLTGTESVIDAYCGIGTISLFLARQAGHVYGVEIVPEAIEDAKRNAELNGIANAAFEAGPAEVVIPRWRKEGIVADVIVVDPPRKGCDPALLDTILAMKPERVVYVSCNPSTLARDLRVLEDGGYRTAEVTPVDMFPWTVHVESCVLLVRK